MGTGKKALPFCLLLQQLIICFGSRHVICICSAPGNRINICSSIPFYSLAVFHISQRFGTAVSSSKHRLAAEKLEHILLLFQEISSCLHPTTCDVPISKESSAQESCSRQFYEELRAGPSHTAKEVMQYLRLIKITNSVPMSHKKGEEMLRLAGRERNAWTVPSDLIGLYFSWRGERLEHYLQLKKKTNNNSPVSSHKTSFLTCFPLWPGQKK